jgi:hypothetical protein
VNKHLTSLLVKFIMIGLISVIILPLFAQIRYSQLSLRLFSNCCFASTSRQALPFQNFKTYFNFIIRPAGIQPAGTK